MLEFKFCIAVFILVSIPSSFQDSPDWIWGVRCPQECECQLTSASQTLISRWKDENSTAKTVLCVLKNETLEKIIELPKDTESLTVLQSNEDHEMTFTHDVLKHFKDLKSIDMQGSLSNSKAFITNDVFHNLESLRYLSLQRIDLTGAQKALAKLSTLEVLYVIHCDIGYLKWEMLDGLKNLKELYLLQSGIKELYGFAFYGTPELRRLFLSHNDLFSVEADAFVGLLKLEYLDLSNNRIDHLSGLTFPPLPHLQYLELKHNPIKVIFPHCFQYLNGTQHLTLGHKKQPVHLMKFSFRGLYSLLFLHIPNIDNDALFEHMFYDLKSLSHMNLRGRIKVVNNRAFNGAHQVLTKLILHDCKIEKVFKDSFFGLEKLHLLDLSGNLLHSFPEGTFNPLKSIQQVLLHDNQLKIVPSNLFIPLTTVRAISLYNNPWNCSCQFQYWKEDIIMSTFEYSKDNEQNKTIENVQFEANMTDITPKCENPTTFEHQSVFLVMKTMGCNRLK